jgi:hypothetical protein
MQNVPILGVVNTKNHPPDDAYIFPERLRYKVWTNEIGCFDYPISIPEKHWLIVGGSFAHNFNRLENKWMSILEKNSKMRIYKCGNQIYGTEQSLIRAETLMKEVGIPQKLILGYAWNDYLDDVHMPRKLFLDGYSIRIKPNDTIPFDAPFESYLQFAKKKYQRWYTYCGTNNLDISASSKFSCWLRRNSVVFNAIQKSFEQEAKHENISILTDQMKFNGHLSILQKRLLSLKKYKAKIYIVECPEKEMFESDNHEKWLIYESLLRKIDTTARRSGVIFCPYGPLLKDKGKDFISNFFFKNDRHMSVFGEKQYADFVAECLNK